MLTINSRGESGQDCFAFEHCGRKKNGTFIDIGCNEPIRWSNTYALEEVGWRGWLVDINSEYTAAIEQERKSPFICVDATIIDWEFVLPAGVSSVDYLSLDIDEDETRTVAIRVLKNLFMDGITWKCATIEHDAYRFGDNPRITLRAMMEDAGYKLYRANVEIGQFRGGDPNWKGNGKPFEDWWIR